MYFLYSLLLAIGFIILIPRFLLDALINGKYVAGFSERLGNLPPLTGSTHPRIWIHCVSVGEAQAARPLVSALRRSYPLHRLLISTTTVTGQRVARELFGNQADAIFYFPFDWAWTTRRALRQLNPAAVLLLETELWPRLLRECRKRNVPVAIVNGRISNNSFRRYQWVRKFVARVVNDLALALMQTEDDAARIRKLGLEPERAVVTGNLKFDPVDDAGEARLTASLQERFGFDEPDKLIIAASTHAPEEGIVLAAFRRIKDATQDQRNLRLLIAPRHPERFSEVAAMLDHSGRTWSRRSSASSATDNNSEIVLLDTVGELRALYPLASIVFVGGSIASAGGHNILEPAANGACIVTGPHTSNFSAIVSDFRAKEALIQLADGPREAFAAELAKIWSELLTNETHRSEIGRRAKALCEGNRGATQRTLDLLAPILASASDAEVAAPAYPGHPALVAK
ncbi:MAG: 3-deoxy-D-manno-octulosonic-acid transferase [Blastocatellia bacterium]|jgi:3-deoxy-D-manno-octulosonic-acid transferase|nr:3-deoxy-D-manno-octulosonic-acid transferase [Blastocatellia bacterium]